MTDTNHLVTSCYGMTDTNHLESSSHGMTDTNHLESSSHGMTDINRLEIWSDGMTDTNHLDISSHNMTDTNHLQWRVLPMVWQIPTTCIAIELYSFTHFTINPSTKIKIFFTAFLLIPIEIIQIDIVCLDNNLSSSRSVLKGSLPNEWWNTNYVPCWLTCTLVITWSVEINEFWGIDTF